MKKPIELHNLEQWRSYEEMVDGEIKKVVRLEKTLLYNVPYAMANGIMRKAMNAPQLPGTFWKIPKNIKQTTV